jgi:hypothetical protein
MIGACAGSDCLIGESDLKVMIKEDAQKTRLGHWHLSVKSPEKSRHHSTTGYPSA